MAPLARLDLDRGGTVARVTLNRPDVRNAFNAELIAELDRTFSELDRRAGVRAIVLAGEGKVFSAGADITWMRASLELSEEANRRDAEALSDMYRAIDRCSKPVVARVHGAAIAGASGLCAVSDIVVAADNAVFGFTETKLGIIPAVISPFVLAKIGVSQARALFLTGERFGAQHALRIGLVHHVVPEADLDGAVSSVLDELMTASPTAVTAAKRTLQAIHEASYEETRAISARAIAAQRTSEEGQEGLRAFLERRKPRWAEE
ncbi:MAG: enoyl-CoA hydratase/isomerase family protein [Candidatus Eremiobacteraeota bacterium]|nr:enoyl-CoA hydratase/isomerase family protein [Candidatus Eremiobacteraeota bacterium]